MPTIVTPTEYLTVNGVVLATPAWDAVTYAPLWDIPGSRGSNIVIPYARGRTAKRRWFDELVVQLPLIIKGERDQDNNVNADTRAGLLTNVEYLQNNLGFAIAGGSGTGTVTASWVRPNGTTKTAPVQPIPPLTLADLGGPGQTRNAMTATLELVFPTGQWT